MAPSTRWRDTTITRTELGGQSMTNLREQAGESFQGGFRGQLFAPDDDGYDEARKIYNAMIDKRPGLIARCADVADVMSAVNLARDHGWTLAVRGGGHNGAGLGTCDDGLVIDLSGMKGVRVDPTRRIARIDGGCTLGGRSIMRPTPSDWPYRPESSPLQGSPASPLAAVSAI